MYYHKILKHTGGAILSLLVILLVWFTLSSSARWPSNLFPSPSQVFKTLIHTISDGAIFGDVLDSAARAYAGILLGATGGLMLGLLTGSNNIASLIISPALNFIRQLPPVALIPLMIIWFGIDNAAKILTIACTVALAVWINTDAGVRRIPTSYNWLIQAKKHSAAAIIFRIKIPAAAPFILTGLRNSAAIAFIMVFVSELAGSASGIGYQISIAQLAYRVDLMIALLIILATLGWLTDVALQITYYLICPWARSKNQI